MRLVLLLLASIACLPMTTEAQTAGAATGARPGAAAPITYTLRFPDAPRHYVDVEASFPVAGQKRIELMMAVWTPGSYLVREYARHVEGVEVVQPSGGPAPIKTRKNRWAIDTGGAARVVVRYRVYGREMTVRTNWIESRFALLQGAARYRAYADLDIKLSRDAAPRLEIANDSDSTFVSNRVGCIVLRPIFDLTAACLEK